MVIVGGRGGGGGGGGGMGYDRRHLDEMACAGVQNLADDDCSIDSAGHLVVPGAPGGRSAR